MWPSGCVNTVVTINPFHKLQVSFKYQSNSRSSATDLDSKIITNNDSAITMRKMFWISSDPFFFNFATFISQLSLIVVMYRRFQMLQIPPIFWRRKIYGLFEVWSILQNIFTCAYYNNVILSLFWYRWVSKRFVMREVRVTIHYLFLFLYS